MNMVEVLRKTITKPETSEAYKAKGIRVEIHCDSPDQLTKKTPIGFKQDTEHAGIYYVGGGADEKTNRSQQSD